MSPWIFQLLVGLQLLIGCRVAAQCATRCRCMDHGTVVACSSSGFVYMPLPLPPATIVLDMNHNHVNILTNHSLNQVPRLEVLSMEDNNMMYIEQGAFDNLHDLAILRLGRNSLTSLPPDLFRHNQKLEVLDMHSNHFRGLMPDVVFAPLHGLKQLNMSFNSLDSANLGTGFRALSRMSALDLTGNNFASFESQAFIAAQSWDNGQPHYLNLSRCNVRHIHRNAFASLKTFESISLAGNAQIPLDELEAALKDLEVSNLRSIDLSGMNISDMYNLFRSFRHKNLEKLFLSHNNIQAIHQRTFFYLVNLHTLDLSFNFISDVRDLSGLTKLHVFNLAHNSIQRLASTALDGLTELRELDLSGNQLSQVSSDPFMTLFSLKTLDLSRNRIEDIDFRSSLETLERLYLQGNHISELQFVRGLPYIRTLDLSKNAIRHIKPNIFTQGQSLQLTNFSHNDVLDVHPEAFQSSSHEVLDLSHNRLKTLTHCGWRGIQEMHLEANDLYNMTPITLAGLPDLVKLHLQANNLFSFPPGSFRDLSSLIYMDLSRNPLGTFLGSLRGAVMISQLHRLQTLHIAHVDLRSLPMSMLSNLTQLETLNLSGNSLHSLGSPCDLSHLNHLQSLDISNNLITTPDPKCFVQRHLRSVDFSRNPLSCSCELMPLQEWVTDTTRNVTVTQVDDLPSYNCVSPPEWKGVSLLDFYMEEASCSHHEKAIIFTAIGCTVVALILLAIVAVLRYKWWYRRKLAQTRYSFIEDSVNGGLGSMSMNSSAISTDGSSTTVVTNRTSKDWV